MLAVFVRGDPVLYRMREKLAAWSGLLCVLFFVGEAVIGGLQLDGYSHARDFISETYASGTPLSDAKKYGHMRMVELLRANGAR